MSSVLERAVRIVTGQGYSVICRGAFKEHKMSFPYIFWKLLVLYSKVDINLIAIVPRTSMRQYSKIGYYHILIAVSFIKYHYLLKAAKYITDYVDIKAIVVFNQFKNALKK